MKRSLYTVLTTNAVLLLLPLTAWANSTAGYNAIAPNTATPAANQVESSNPIVPTIASTFGDCQVYVISDGSGTGHLNCAIYDSSAGAPTTPICQSTQQAVNTSNHWYVFDVSACGTATKGHLYFAAINKDDATISFTDTGAGGTIYFKSQTYGTFGSLSGASTTADVYSIYVDLVNTLTQCGNSAIQSSQLGSVNDNVIATPCTPIASSTVNDIQIFIQSCAGNWNAAIYNMAGGVATTEICRATLAACAAWQWNSLDMSSAGCGSFSAATPYGVAFNVSSGTSTMARTTGASGSSSFQAQTCCGMTDLSSATASTTEWSAYVNLVGATKRHQVITSSSSNQKNIQQPGLGLEPTPSMGMVFANLTYDDLTHEPSQAQVEAQADLMVSTGLVAAGINTLRSAYIWASSISGCTLQLNSSPLYTDMTALTNYLHADGVRHQIYLSSGSPACGAAPSSLGCESTVAAQVAGYGADSIENDTCTVWSDRQTAQAVYTTLGTALHNTGRPMQYMVSISNLPTNSVAQGYWCPSAYGTEWWSAPDTGANPTYTSYASNILDTISPTGSLTSPGALTPGCWAMPLYIVTGTTSLLTTTQIEGVMSLFSVVPAPIWWFLNLTTQCATSPCTSSSPEITLMTNKNVIAVDQDPLAIPAALISSVSCGSSGCNVLQRPIQGGAYSMAAWNRDTASHAIAMALPSGTWNGYDLWAGSSLGSLSGTYTPTVAATGVVHIALCPGVTNWNTSATPYPKCQ